MRTWLALAASAVVLASCGGERRDLRADDAWVRLPAVAGGPAAGYFMLHGGPADATLTRVTSSAAIRTELHRSVAQNGVTTMQPLGSVPVPANGKVAFAPGGNHVMLFDVDPSVVAGSTMPLSLEFADGKKVAVQAKAVAAGDPVPDDK